MSPPPLGERSVLLLKPDGFRSAETRAFARERMKAHGLHEEQSYVMQFQEADVLDVWPKFGSSKYPLSRILSLLYLTAGPSEVVVVSGCDAPMLANRVKHEVRKRYGDGMFCNRIHAPEGPDELNATLAKFREAVPNATPHTRHGDSGDVPGIWGPLADLPLDVLQKAAERVWEMHVEGGWEALRRPPPDGYEVAVLHAGDPHSIDYGMSALAELAPHEPVEEVIRIYLEADVFGQAVVEQGSPAAVERVRDKLVTHGLHASTIWTERPDSA